MLDYFSEFEILSNQLPTQHRVMHTINLVPKGTKPTKKLCPSCRKLLLREEFARGNKICKRCAREKYKREWSEKHPKKPKRAVCADPTTCAVCGNVQPARDMASWSRCKKCEAAEERLRYATDEEHRKKINAYNNMRNADNPKRQRYGGLTLAEWAVEIDRWFNVYEKDRRLAGYGSNTCSACGKVKQWRYFYRKGGFSATCNTCNNARKRQQAQAKRPPKVIEPPCVPRMRKTVNRRYSKRKERQNPMVRINRSFENSIRLAIRSAKDWRLRAGYTNTELKARLKALFTEGMTWENYGEWHVDHIKPRCAFNYVSVDDPQFLECWGLPNLQPLWAEDNIAKGAKHDEY